MKVFFVWLHVGIAACLGLLAGGCASRSTGLGSLTGPNIRELHVLTMPMALNLDRRPGADGFALKVYAVDPDRPKSVRIHQGRLDILIYEGIQGAGTMRTNPPLSRWAFTAAQLAPYAQETSVGTVYAITPTWKEKKPRGEKITVLACYGKDASVEPEKAGVCSAPTTVTVALP